MLIGVRDYHPEAFANGIEGFEQWVIDLKEEIDVRTPI